MKAILFLISILSVPAFAMNVLDLKAGDTVTLARDTELMSLDYVYHEPGEGTLKSVGKEVVFQIFGSASGPGALSTRTFPIGTPAEVVESYVAVEPVQAFGPYFIRVNLILKIGGYRYLLFEQEMSSLSIPRGLPRSEKLRARHAVLDGIVEHLREFKYIAPAARGNWSPADDSESSSDAQSAHKGSGEG